MSFHDCQYCFNLWVRWAEPEGQTLSLEERRRNRTYGPLVSLFLSLVMLSPAALYCHLKTALTGGLLFKECDVCLSGMSSEEIRARVYAPTTSHVNMCHSTCMLRRHPARPPNRSQVVDPWYCLAIYQQIWGVDWLLKQGFTMELVPVWGCSGSVWQWR